jgi:hypothetical protein
MAVGMVTRPGYEILYKWLDDLLILKMPTIDTPDSDTNHT